VVGDHAVLAYELIETLGRHDASSIGTTIGPMACSRCRAVDHDPKMHWSPVGARSKHEMQIPRMKTVDDCASRLVQRGMLT
jgi:hypothetical protein